MLHRAEQLEQGRLSGERQLDVEALGVGARRETDVFECRGDVCEDPRIELRRRLAREDEANELCPLGCGGLARAARRVRALGRRHAQLREALRHACRLRRLEREEGREDAPRPRHVLLVDQQRCRQDQRSVVAGGESREARVLVQEVDPLAGVGRIGKGARRHIRLHQDPRDAEAVERLLRREGDPLGQRARPPFEALRVDHRPVGFDDARVVEGGQRLAPGPVVPAALPRRLGVIPEAQGALPQGDPGYHRAPEPAQAGRRSFD